MRLIYDYLYKQQAPWAGTTALFNILYLVSNTVPDTKQMGNKYILKEGMADRRVGGLRQKWSWGMPQILSQQTIPRSSQRQMTDNSVVLLVTMMVGIKELVVCLKRKILRQKVLWNTKFQGAAKLVFLYL